MDSMSRHDTQTSIEHEVYKQDLGSKGSCPYPDIAAARDISELNQAILDCVNQLGLTDYWFLPLHQLEKEVGWVSSLPQAFFADYREAKLRQYDLLLDYAKEQSRPLYASTLYEYLQESPVDCGWLRGMREIQALHAAYGFYDFYCVIVRGTGGAGRGLLALSHHGLAAGPDFRQCLLGKAATLQALAGVINATGQQHFPELFVAQQAPPPALTPQPLKVLATLANKDMTITQLADKLYISPVTVHHHITTARKALGTRTNIGAIKKAMQLGLIEYVE